MRRSMGTCGVKDGEHVRKCPRFRAQFASKRPWECPLRATFRRRRALLPRRPGAAPVSTHYTVVIDVVIDTHWVTMEAASLGRGPAGVAVHERPRVLQIDRET